MRLKKTELGIFVLFFEYRVNISYFCAFRIFLRKLYICKKTKNYDTNVMEILIFIIMINFYN